MRALRNLTVTDGFVLALMLFFTLCFFHARGSADMDRFWLDWVYTLSLHDNFKDGYNGVWADYPSLSIFWLYLIQRFSVISGLEPFVLIKASVLLFLWLTAAVYYRVSADKGYTLLMYCFLLLSSVMLAYLDIWYAPFLVLCLSALKEERVSAALFWFAVCCSIKYQPAIIAPFIAVYVCKIYQGRPGGSVRQGVQALGLTLFLYLLVMFSMVGMALLDSWVNALFHSRLSFQGLNAYWAYMEIQVLRGEDFRSVRNSSTGLLMGSRVLFLLIEVLLLWRLAKARKNFTVFLLFAMVGYYSYFVVISGVHENHLFVAAVLASVLYLEVRAMRSVALFIMLMNVINLFLFNGLTGGGLSHALALWGLSMSVPVAIINSLFFVYLLLALLIQGGRPYCFEGEASSGNK